MRRIWLDGLRGLAALNVMLSHFVVAFDFALYTGLPAQGHFGWETRVSSWPLLWPVAGANGAVCVFFVLSGYVLAIAYGRTTQHAAILLLRRILRLVLPILAAVLLSWALVQAGAMANLALAPITRSDWLAGQMLGRPGIGAALYEGTLGALIDRLAFGATLDSSLWTMPIEFAGSLLLIALFCGARAWSGKRAGRITARRPSRRQAGWLLVLLAWGLRDYYLCLFALGAGICLIDPAPRQGKWGGLACLLGGLVLGSVPYSAARGPVWDWLVAHAPVPPPVPPWPAHFPGLVRLDGPGFWHAAGAGLILLSFVLWPRLRGGLQGPVVQFFGRISFPLYLVHVPILLSFGCRAFLAARGQGLSGVAAASIAFGVFAALAIGAATLGAWLVERPAIRLSARIGGLLTPGGIKR